MIARLARSGCVRTFVPPVRRAAESLFLSCRTNRRSSFSVLARAIFFSCPRQSPSPPDYGVSESPLEDRVPLFFLNIYIILFSRCLQDDGLQSRRAFSRLEPPYSTSFFIEDASRLFPPLGARRFEFSFFSLLGEAQFFVSSHTPPSTYRVARSAGTPFTGVSRWS